MFQGGKMENVNLKNFESVRQFRETLVPTWIRIFGRFIIIFAAFVALAYGFSLTNDENKPISIGMYGFFYKGNPYHPIPIYLALLILGNGACAYALLTGRRWAVSACLFFAYITLGTTVIGKLNYHFSYFPFEFLFILPYLYALHKLRTVWKDET
jgi:hypothetical protein